MPSGHSLSIYARFLGKTRTSPYISREQGDHYYIQTRHNGLKSAHIYTERVYRIVLMPPGHPIILLESNKFVMAAVSVERSI